MRSRPALAPLLLALVASIAVAWPARAGYDKPPQNVLDVLHAPSPPQPYLSPTRDRILLVSWVDYPPIAQVAEPFLRLAGVRVEPRTRRKHDTPGGYGDHALRADAHARRRRDQPRDARDAAAGRLRRRPRVGRRRQALRVPQHLGRRRRALDRRRGDRRDAAPRRRAAEPDARQLAAVDARSEVAAREARPRRRRAAARARRSRRRPEHPGDRRRRRREQHVRDARHADEQARRGSLRLLRDRQLALVDADAGAITPHRQARASSPRSTPRPTASTSCVDDDPEAVLVRDDLRSLRARRRGLGPHRHVTPHARVAAARRSRADARRADRAARLRVAPDRAGDAGLGRGARRRRLERQGARARQGA